MTDTTTGDDAIKAAADAIAAPPPIDHEPVLRLAATTRAGIVAGLTDPSSIYHNRADLLAQHDAEVAELFVRKGITAPAPLSPQQRAARDLEASFPSRGHELEPHIQALIDDDLAALGKLPRDEQDRRGRDLREELGPDFARLVEQAKASDAWRPEVALSRRALVLLAGVGRYRAAYDRAIQPKRS